MTEITSVFSESVQKVGRAFLLAYYLPSTLMTVIQVYIFIPAWLGYAPLTYLPVPIGGGAGTQQIDITHLLAILFVPLLVGMVLQGLNHGLIQMYEGRPRWLKYTLLFPLYRYQQHRHRTHYHELVALQQQHMARAVKLSEQHDNAPDAPPLTLRQELAALQQQIIEYQNNLERKSTGHMLPLAKERLAPTAFGNAYALAEEYAQERYGIDPVLFWPRLRDLMDTTATTLSERLTQQKTHLDMVLNLTFLSGIVALECLLTFVFAPQPGSWVWLVGMVGALFLKRSFYGESVHAVQLQGELIKMSFDFHRHRILDAFKLRTPDDLMTEQILWVRLAAFIRRGNPFYFPSDMVDSERMNRSVQETS